MKRVTAEQLHRPGFALLITLVLLTLAAVLLAEVARASLHQATLAQRLEGELQRRWISTSCQAALLPKVEQALSEAETEDDDRPFALDHAAEASSPGQWRSLTLGEYQVRLVLADEQAKWNVNAALDHKRAGDPGGVPGGDVENHLQQLLREAGTQARVQLRTVGDFERHMGELGELEEHWPQVGSFAQLSDELTPAALIGEPERPGVAAYVTLWGDGRAHLLRAPPAVLAAVLSPDLGPGHVNQLMLMRQEEANLTVARALSRLELTRQQRRRIEARLTDRSTCHSLWLAIDDGQRTWHELVVQDGEGEGGGGDAGASVHRLIW